MNRQTEAAAGDIYSAPLWRSTAKQTCETCVLRADLRKHPQVLAGCGSGNEGNQRYLPNLRNQLVSSQVKGCSAGFAGLAGLIDQGFSALSTYSPLLPSAQVKAETEKTGNE